MATIIGTPAALAILMLSTVCSMTPSSAATTKTTISVHCAPRFRIEQKAAWPGVSKKVIVSLPNATLKAPICCVIPPNSESTIADSRKVSKSVVLP
uniref:Putative secreted protein n=1 Tax=Panstrongylus lignarius TaxID=156445 RepID=A0A224Y3J4_9HEMI